MATEFHDEQIDENLSTPSALASTVPGSADAAVAEQLSRLSAALDTLAEVDASALSDGVLVEAAQVAERLARRTSGAVTDRLVVEVSDRSADRRLGYRNLSGFLASHLHVGDPAARYWLIAETGTFTSILGERVAPKCPTLAERVAQGLVAPAHARAVIDVLNKIPRAVPAETRAAAEVQMADYATSYTPAEISSLGARLLAHLDPDGSLTDAKDRKRRRAFWVNRQDAQLMSRLTADLDPAARARLDAVLDAWGKPGMNNPDDPDSPSGPVGSADPDLLRAAAQRDERSAAQRNHDAFSALLARVLDSGMLGKSHRGLPIQVIVKTSLTELEQQAGLAQTASGALLPIKDLIEMAATSGAQPFLAVFAEHTSVPLYLGRSKRIATLGQRFASFASDGGGMCSAPGCTQPASRVQMHHAAKDWAKGGLTDIDQLVPACDVHNSKVGPNIGQYTTRMITDGPDTGRVAWRLNASPGMPPNREHVNRMADVAADFRDYLASAHTGTAHTHTEQINPEQINAEHTATDTTGHPAGITTAGGASSSGMTGAGEPSVGGAAVSPRRKTDTPSAYEQIFTGVELRLVASMLTDDTPAREKRVDFTWNPPRPLQLDPDPPTDPGGPSDPGASPEPDPPAAPDSPGGVDPPLSDAA